MKHNIIYYNLTQIKIYDNFEKYRFLYLRSTDIEQMNWDRLLWSFPDELLFYLSLGYKVTLKDCSSNKRGSKIIRIFIPVFKDILNYVQYKSKIPQNKHLIDHFYKAKEIVDSNRLLRTKLKRFTIPSNNIYNNLVGISIIVPKEENIF